MIVRASGIEFDFSNSLKVEEHDVARPQGAGNTVFQGVDFVVEETDRWLWIEVKNFVSASVPPRQRGGLRRRFPSQMHTGVLRDWFRGKFIGTAAFKAFVGDFPSDGRPILYVVMIESYSSDSALRSTMLTSLRSSLGCPALFQPQFSTVVLSLSGWNQFFPLYPARIV